MIENLPIKITEVRQDMPELGEITLTTFFKNLTEVTYLGTILILK